MLSIFAKWKGASYLRDTLQKVVERLMLTSNDLDLELDPARVSSSEELHKNAMQLRIVAKVFIDDICSSTENMPVPFRRICSIVRRKSHGVGPLVLIKIRLIDLFCSPPAIPRGKVHGSGRLHLPAVLLPRHSRTRGRGACHVRTFQGNATGPVADCEGCPEPGKQCAVWGQGALHVCSQ